MERTLPAPLALNWLTANPARSLVFALVGAWAIVGVYANVTHWYMADADAYWQGAMRLRDGSPLYFSTPTNPGNAELYRYPPWFAVAWLPLTYLPHGLVMALWGAVLVAAAVYVAWPSRHPASVALTLLLLPDLVRVASTGNVQPLLLAMLLGPAWLTGIAAGLKGWPILFALRFGRRAWIPVAVAAVLWAPILLFDLSGYPASNGLQNPGMFATMLVVAKLIR